MNVSIFGLGYVGTVTAGCLSRYGHYIIGVDTSPDKVDFLNKGMPPIVEPGIANLSRTAFETGRLLATTDYTSAILRTDLSLICVGTPSNSNGSLNLEYIFAVAEQVGRALKAKHHYHAIAIRSTALPGTADKVSSIIEKLSGKRLGKDFGVASNPEFLREGTAVYDFENPPYTVVGASDKRVIEMLKKIYEPINAPFYAIKTKEAELLKYACNAFHAVKVTFANEIGAISKKLGIDSHVVMEIFSEDTKLNISSHYLKPGFAFGGSCLPKDVRAISYESRLLDISTPLLDSLIPSNELQIQRVVEWVIEKKKKNIGVLGLTFKSETDDTRESPIVKVIETLSGKGFTISVYDANVNLSKLIGANKRYLEQEIPHISSLMKKSVQEVIDHADVILIANRAAEFEDVLKSLKRDQIVLDFVRIADHWNDLHGNYEGICW